ncbi:hypothetical protein [Hugenholtzia roseola]|uniref:hypothetical protein n=1 Tax=Hugenholtzia roseola TaxID=1002 RepID=UPI00137736C1|nr:hypothetical protein [Hugenholtzia roseola]
MTKQGFSQSLTLLPQTSVVLSSKNQIQMQGQGIALFLPSKSRCPLDFIAKCSPAKHLDKTKIEAR